MYTEKSRGKREKSLEFLTINGKTTKTGRNSKKRKKEGKSCIKPLSNTMSFPFILSTNLWNYIDYFSF